MRLFVALDVLPEVRRRLYEATAAMRDAARGVSWTVEANLHLTLKFLGERPEEALGPLAERLRAVAGGHRPLSLGLGGLGAFPNLRAPRIVWLGVAQDPRLELLHHDVETGCEALGYPVEGRAFRPHITLGRVRRELAAGEARALAEAARAVPFRATAVVDEMRVMSSALTPAGSRYTIQAALPFGGE
jgi:RNA 2',3'-cyclic 3'-phosphodiesterase